MLAFRPDTITSSDVIIYRMMGLIRMCSATLFLVFSVFFKRVIEERPGLVKNIFAMRLDNIRWKVTSTNTF